MPWNIPGIDPNASPDQIVNILIQMGMNPDNVDQVKTQLQDVNSQVQAMGAGTGTVAPKVAGDINTIAQSFRGLMQAGRLMTSIGRAETIFGRLFKDEDVRRMGEITRGIGLMVISVGRLRNVIDALNKAGGISNIGGTGLSMGLGSLLGAGLAGVGGAIVGAKYYDAVIGGLPGQQTYNYQTKQMEANTAGHIFAQVASVASYNLTMITGDADRANKAFLDTAHMYGLITNSAEQANEKMLAFNNQFKYKPEGKIGAEQLLAPLGITDVSQSGLEAQLSKWKVTLSKLESGELLEGPNLTLAEAQTKVQKIEEALGMIAKQFEMTPDVQAFVDYQKQLADSEQKYGEERNKINEETLKQINTVTKRWDTETAKAYDDFLRQNRDAAIRLSKDIRTIQINANNADLKAEQEYYAKRANEARDFGIEISRLEQDHQTQVERQSQDHQITIRKLAEQLDAGAIEDERAKYRLDQSRQEQDFQKEIARKNEDYARKIGDDQAQYERERSIRAEQEATRIAELKQNYAEESATRKTDFTQKAKDRNDQYAAEVADLQQNGTDKLTELGKQHQSEMDDINANWDDRRRQLGIWLAGERDQFYNYMQARQNDLQAWVNTHLSIPGVPGTNSLPTTTQLPTEPMYSHQWGGYQSRMGWALLHGGEFVMNADTTKKAEQMVGGALTQQNVMNGGMSISIDQHFMGQESEPATYKRLVYEVITEVFTKARQQQLGRVGP